MGVSSQIIERWECEACKCSATINASQRNGHSGVDGWHHVAVEIPQCHVDKLLLCPKCIKKLKDQFNELTQKKDYFHILPIILKAYNNLFLEIEKEKAEEEKERINSLGVKGNVGCNRGN